MPTADDLDPDAQYILDGTLLPCWSWDGHKELYSGKHKTTGMNVQVACTIYGKLAWISDPVNGSRHDNYCQEESASAAAAPADWVGDRMVLAIEADGASYRLSGSVRDRDRLRGEHLQRLGWSFHRLWSTNWFYDAKAEVTKLRDAYDRAVAAADEAAPPEPAGAAGAAAAGGAARRGPGAGARPQCPAGAGDAKFTVIRRNPREPSIPLSIPRVLRSASASSGLCRAAVWIRCWAAM